MEAVKRALHQLADRAKDLLLRGGRPKHAVVAKRGLLAALAAQRDTRLVWQAAHGGRGVRADAAVHADLHAHMHACMGGGQREVGVMCQHAFPPP